MKTSLISTIICVVVIAGVAYLALGVGNNQQNNTKNSDQESASSEPRGVTDIYTQVAPETSPVASVSAIPVATTVATSSVIITDEGFSPATLTVKAGTTVVFTNNGQGLHWPVSDPHPVHTGLAGFDAKKGLATGETYSFTFAKTGTFGMHDHLRTSLKGSIIVQ